MARVGSQRSAGLTKGDSGRAENLALGHGSAGRAQAGSNGGGQTRADARGQGLRRGVTSPGWPRGRPGGAIAEPQALQQLTQPRPAGVDPHDPPPAPAAWTAQHVQGEEQAELLHHLGAQAVGPGFPPHRHQRPVEELLGVDPGAVEVGAHPGRLRLQLDDGVLLELTAKRRSRRCSRLEDRLIVGDGVALLDQHLQDLRLLDVLAQVRKLNVHGGASLGDGVGLLGIDPEVRGCARKARPLEAVGARQGV